MPANVAFTFGEAELWVTIPSGGLASQSVGFVRRYSDSRTPVKNEDGSVAYFRDRFGFSSPWVTPEVETLFVGKQPIDIVMRWRNEDDGRLQSAVVLGAVMMDSQKAPGDGEVEEYSFSFEGFALA